MDQLDVQLSVVARVRLGLLQVWRLKLLRSAWVGLGPVGLSHPSVVGAACELRVAPTETGCDEETAIHAYPMLLVEAIGFGCFKGW